MEIQGSLLEALGVNLYSSIAKCLVEFAANAHDSDSPLIEITIPFTEIERERQRLRDEAKAKIGVTDGVKRKAIVVLEPLPHTISITIADKGHGMRAAEIQDKFLPLNRNRRDGGTTEAEKEKLRFTESGKRLVMGRKGLGKLAAFGAALKVTVRSKRAGDTYATEFTMDYETIRRSSRLDKVEFLPKYEDGLDVKDQGTTITLSELRCDAVSSGLSAIQSVLRDNFFGIESDDFKILINGQDIPKEEAPYEFIYPESRPYDDLAELEVAIPQEMGSFTIKLKAMFRERGSHLSGARRGARFYCNHRLAAGPTLVDLHSGIHNFQATAYMECVVRADELDSLGIDLINTNRTDFRRDNDIVAALLKIVTDFMKDALGAHSKFRDARADEDLKNSQAMKDLDPQLDVLSKRTKTAAINLLKVLAKHEDPNGEAFKAVAPLLIQSVNSGDVLVKLMEMSHRDSSLKEIVRELHKLATIEHRDSLKLFRARRNGITALQNLIKKGDESWKQTPNIEGAASSG